MALVRKMEETGGHAAALQRGEGGDGFRFNDPVERRGMGRGGWGMRDA